MQKITIIRRFKNVANEKPQNMSRVRALPFTIMHRYCTLVIATVNFPSLYLYCRHILLNKIIHVFNLCISDMHLTALG